MLATINGHFSCVKLLLQLRANVYASDVCQRTALHRGVSIEWLSPLSPHLSVCACVHECVCLIYLLPVIMTI